jgi:hypothetical protein
LNTFIDIDVVLGSVNNLLLEFNKLSEISTLVDSEERREPLSKDLALSEVERFLVLNLISEESDKLKGNLVILESFNVSIVLGTSFLKERFDKLEIGVDADLKPSSKVLSISKLSLSVSKNLVKITAFLILRSNRAFKVSDVFL